MAFIVSLFHLRFLERYVTDSNPTSGNIISNPGIDVWFGVDIEVGVGVAISVDVGDVAGVDDSVDAEVAISADVGDVFGVEVGVGVMSRLLLPPMTTGEAIVW